MAKKIGEDPISSLRKEIEDLKKERDVAKSYLKIASTIIVALDSKGIVKFVNKKGCETLRYGEDELLGKNWIDLAIPKQERALVKRFFGGVMRGEMKFIENTENSIVAKNGETRLIAWHNSPIREKGKIVGTLSSGEDITARKMAENALKSEKDELEKFNKMMIDRELRMAELKKEVNSLLKRLGEKERYGAE